MCNINLITLHLKFKRINLMLIRQFHRSSDNIEKVLYSSYCRNLYYTVPSYVGHTHILS